MNGWLKATRATLMGSGVLLLALGLIIWTGVPEWLVGVHSVLGFVFVLALLTLAGIGARAGVPGRRVLPVVVWAVVVVMVGGSQEQLLPGGWHWTVQVLHLAVGVAAMWAAWRLLSLITAQPKAQPATDASLRGLRSPASRAPQQRSSRPR